MQITGRSRAALRYSVTSLATPMQKATRKCRLENILIVTVRVKIRSTVVGGHQLFGITYGLHRQGQGEGKGYKDDTKSIHSMEHKTS